MKKYLTIILLLVMLFMSYWAGKFSNNFQNYMKGEASCYYSSGDVFNPLKEEVELPLFMCDSPWIIQKATYLILFHKF